MANIIIDSPKSKIEIQGLLESQIPAYRQAYSDRTAWLMSCVSELAYIKFNPCVLEKESKIIKKISEFLDNKKKDALNKIVDLVAYDSVEEKEKLISELSSLDIKLIKTFDKNGTQALLLSTKENYILAFRGTEPTSLEDIKADLDAKIIKCATGGKVHRGFDQALNEVCLDIQEYLESDTIEKKSLFITGHSLGGALATLATKRLRYKHGIAACYTFGAPRVGDEEWIEGIKTSIYRVVNSADPVTMLPPGDDTIKVSSWLIKFLPIVGETIRSYLLSNFKGYYHAGDMRYLTNIQDGDYSQAKRLYAVSFNRRVKAYFHNKISWKQMPSDHSITIYRKKLFEIAKKRQELFHTK